jgi:hypothetical protein
MAQCGWAPEKATPAQTIEDFMRIFYGPTPHNMVEIYRDLQRGARFCEESWDRVDSKARGQAYGYSEAKRPVGRTDLTLSPPALPRLPGLDITPGFHQRYEAVLSQAPRQLADNEGLIARLNANLARAGRNRYNLEVLLSLAHLQRHHIRMLLELAKIEDLLIQAGAEEKAHAPARALECMRQASDAANEIIADLSRTFEQVKAVWEKGRLPRNAPVNGKEFRHVMDDVKDHFADRRADLSYLIAPEESMDLPKWRAALEEVMSSL